VVADVANLPFKPQAFDGIVSLHTIHHLPEDEHLRAFGELYRVLAPGKQAVVVNGWAHSPFVSRFEGLIRLANRTRHIFDRLTGRKSEPAEDAGDAPEIELARRMKKPQRAGQAVKGTFTNKHDAAWVNSAVGALAPVEVLVWRSVTVRFMRALIHPHLGGRLWLRLIYRMEERHPHYFGENGKYPLIVIRKPKEA
jgi:SAM-dependent methyltransferase